MHKYPGTQHGFHNNSTPRTNRALLFGALDIEASGVRRLVTGERHCVLLGQLGVAKLGHATMAAGRERQIVRKLARQRAR